LDIDVVFIVLPFSITSSFLNLKRQRSNATHPKNCQSSDPAVEPFSREEVVITLLQAQEMCLRFQSARKAGELSREADGTVAWSDNGHRIFTVRSADSPGRIRISQLLCQLTLSACLAEWDGQQCFRNLL
jgi:hypothetical protein